jgi:hypothetical protein
MALVQGPPVGANIKPEPALLDEPFRRIVTRLAQAHKRPEPEFINVASMRLDVITDCRRRDDAAIQTELAERLLEQLVLSDAGPAVRAIPSIPFRWLAANAVSV